MSARSQNNQIAFRYRAVDSATGVSRKTAKRLAAQLGVGFLHAQLRGQAFCGLAAYAGRAINGAVAKSDLIVLAAGAHRNSSSMLDILKISNKCGFVNPRFRPTLEELDPVVLDAAGE